MPTENIRRIETEGAELAARERGSGDPVVFAHGAMGDECAAVVVEPALTSQYRVIDYHRRGWGESSRAEGAVSMSQQVADCKAVMAQFGVQRAHCVGQSGGGLVMLQTALDAPEIVHSLALLEPALPSVLSNSPVFGAVFERAGAMYGAGDKAGAVEVFAKEVGGADVQTTLDRTMPPGWFQRWIAAADTMFQADTPGQQDWSFTRADAARIKQPVLNVVGVHTNSYFREAFETVRTWLPQAENVELPNANHCILQTNPKGAAEKLASFFARHPL